LSAGGATASGASPLSSDGELKVREIHGGNLNYSFAVEDAIGGAVFVKQAPGFIKVLGAEAKLASDRMKLERAAYLEWEQLLGPEISGLYFPRIYSMDDTAMAVIMEFLGSYRLLQESLFAGVANARVAASLGEVMGWMHAKTHCSKVSPEEAKRLWASFENPRLRDIQLEYVFSKCFREDPRAAYLREDPAFLAEVDALKAAYRGEDKGDLALVHGDLHAGSVMVDDGAGAVKLIDPEFAIYGPPGLDVGSLLSTYAMAYCFRRVSAAGEGCDAILEAIGACWSKYAATLSAAGVAPEVVASAGELALGFAGCEVARTALGLAFERSIRLDDADAKAKAEAGALKVGEQCIRCRRGRGPELLQEELRKFDVSV